MRRNKTQYRKRGILEYLIHLPTGNIVVANCFSRIDTFEYRNNTLKPKRLRWMLHDTAKNVLKLPKGGRLGYQKETLFWFANNLNYNKETRTFSCEGMKNFQGLSLHDIVIKNSKTGISKTFVNDHGMYEKFEKGEKSFTRLWWVCDDLTFEVVTEKY
jgi:hypothetical protein